MIKVYTIPNCSHCQETKDFLLSNDIKFEEIDMSQGRLIEDKKKFKKMGLKTFPIIVITKNGEELIFPEFDTDVMKELKEV